MVSRGASGALMCVAAMCAILLWGCRSPETPEESAVAAPATPATDSVREPAVAGAFYPADPDELRTTVEGLLDEAERAELPGQVVALMAPHAGYIFSGHTAAAAYAQVQDAEIEAVIIVGPSHRFPVDGIALPDSTTWRTPLGEVPIDGEICAALEAASDRCHRSKAVHRHEHSIEVQLPFLQVALGDFALVPLVISDFSDENCSALADAIAQVAAGRSVLLVASTDMSHYPAYEEACRVDRAMLETITSFDTEAIRTRDAELLGEGVAALGCTLCGLGPLIAVMDAASQLGADSAHVIEYRNSGDAPEGDGSRCVGYGAVAFCGPKAAEPEQDEDAEPDAEEPQDTALEGEVGEAQQETLLALARASITAAVNGEELPDPPTDAPIFSEPRAVFVTLHREGRLRGCIGGLEARQPLGEAVISAAVSAALRDPRFPPVSPHEVEDLHIEISVLSPMRLVESPDEIVVGTHGVLVRQGGRSGVFLPQVAPEQGWDRETMLSNLCSHKAGLPADAWQHGAELHVFTAQVFAEDEQETGRE